MGTQLGVCVNVKNDLVALVRPSVNEDSKSHVILEEFTDSVQYNLSLVLTTYTFSFVKNPSSQIQGNSNGHF